MISRLLRSVKRHCAHFMVAHVLLASMTPWLHAHSVEPISQDTGFHVFVASADNLIGVCPISGEHTPVLTADISEKRTLDEASTTPPPGSAIPYVVLGDCQENTPTNRWQPVDDDSLRDTVPPLSALPQAP